MGKYQIAFDHPQFLVLLGLLPLLWLWSRRSLSVLGPFRKFFAMGLRTVVLVLIVLAMADIQWIRRSDRVSVIYLLDQSESIPRELREAMVEYVSADVRRHRSDSRGDRAGVITFGREANIEIPPVDDDLPLSSKLETVTNLSTDATNLESAITLASATFSEDTAGRIVIVSDGNENIGNALAIAQQSAKDGIGIDVVPIPLNVTNEIAVERVLLPAEIRKGQPFESRVVITNLSDEDDASPPVRGTLRLSRRMGRREEPLNEQSVELPAGKTVFRFEHEIDQPDFYEYRAQFTPDDATQDRVAQNNRATAYTHVRGSGHVLMIEDWTNRDESGLGEFNYLAERLRRENIECTVQFTDELFSSLAELQRYDSVILANAPRSSGNAEQLADFSDSQVEMLVRNVQQIGSGLIMLGGPNSLGAGGWANTELEKAMPVDFQIRNAKAQAVGALVMVMHASEMAEGNYWQKVVGREALKTLGSQDYCGVVHWDNETWKEGWLWGQPDGLIKIGRLRSRMVAAIDRMTPGDMPDFDPALKLALAAFNRVQEASVKHMIVISDGDPAMGQFRLVRQLKQVGVSISTVAVGAHGPAGHRILQRIAGATEGKYYVVKNAKALPKIFRREARRVARPLVFEKLVQPQIVGDHESLEGIDRVPAIKGFVMSTLKQNPLVEVPIISPEPPDADNATILATWTYGLGKTAVWATDAGQRWTGDWTQWEQYDKLFSQLVRWSMRPTGESGDFSVATRVDEDRVQIVVDALDKDDQYLNFLTISGTAIDPSLKSSDMRLEQVNPGRYVASYPTHAAGSHMVTISPGGGHSPIRIGVTVPYAQEYRDRETNRSLLESLSKLEPEGGEPGKLIDDVFETQAPDERHATDTFRMTLARAASSNYIWPWLILTAGCVFFGDVFVRRVAIRFTRLYALLSALGQRPAAEEDEDQRLDQLRRRKEVLSRQIDQRRAATRFEPETAEPVAESAPDAIDVTQQDATASPPSADKQSLGAEEEPEDYADRLLKAKRRLWKDQDNR